MSTKKLQGQVAIITGSSRGMGRASALLFAKEGANIVVNYSSNVKAAEDVVSKIKKMGSGAVAVQADVGNLKDHQKLVDAALNNFGRIDILFHNAAQHIHTEGLHDVTEEIWDRSFNQIAKGSFFLTKLVVPHMLKQGKGNVLFTSTSSTGVILPLDPHYMAAKGAVNVIVKLLTGMLGPKIRVNCVMPGLIMTDMFRHHPPEVWENFSNGMPMRRMGFPEDVAKAALWLVSPEQEYITGVTIPVDGGRTASTVKEANKKLFDGMLVGLDLYDESKYEKFLELRRKAQVELMGEEM